MKKILSLIACTFCLTALFAQDTTAVIPKKKKPIDLSNRSNDHLLIQFGYTGWAGAPDSVSTKTAGFSKSFNVYFMYDFPFKTNPKLSMAFGPGISTDHIVFTKTYIGIKDIKTPSIRFANRSDTDHYKKTKLATAYLEAPIEFRYCADPANPNKSFKAAIGVKIGTMINAHTRNTKYENRSEVSLTDATVKEASKHFFNKNRLSAMARVGLGHFTLYGSYQLTTLFKDGGGPPVKPFSIGITLSGL
jgi:Outer membrane protein beta-barrel domain